MKLDIIDINRETRRAIDRYIRSKRFNNPRTKKKKLQYCSYLSEYLESKRKSVKQINRNDLHGFIEFMDHKVYRGSLLSPTTKLSTYNEIYLFLNFLSHIPGFKRTITYEIVKFFKLSPNEKKKLRGSKKKIKVYPTLEQIHTIIDSIQKDNIIGKRTVALIVYLFLTGARIEAAATMKLGLVDLVSRIVRQDPDQGVKTKFGKYIETTIPYFDEELFQLFATWINERKKLGAGDSEPLFPAAKSMKEEGYIQFGVSKDWSNLFMNPKSLNKLVKEACRNAGFPDFHCHSFRDSHIYYGLKSAKNYVEVKAVSLNVGHESVETTLKEYADLAPKEVHEIMSKLGENNNSKGIPGELEEKFKSSLKTWEPELYEKYYGKGAKDEL